MNKGSKLSVVGFVEELFEEGSAMLAERYAKLINACFLCFCVSVIIYSSCPEKDNSIYNDLLLIMIF